MWAPKVKFVYFQWVGNKIRVIVCLMAIKMYCCILGFSKHVENNIPNARVKYYLCIFIENKEELVR